MTTDTAYPKLTPIMVTAAEMQLRDVIRLSPDDGPFMDLVVRQIDPDAGKVHLFRIYIHAADFDYTGGVPLYIGTEDLSFWLKSDRQYVLVERRRSRSY